LPGRQYGLPAAAPIGRFPPEEAVPLTFGKTGQGKRDGGGIDPAIRERVGQRQTAALFGVIDSAVTRHGNHGGVQSLHGTRAVRW